MDNTASSPTAPSAARRPLKSRETGWAKAFAKRLTVAGVTPNAISVISIIFSIVAAGVFVGVRFATNPIVDVVLYLVAIGGIQGRLMCNLMDGMVAIEGGRKTPAGAIYNELPDRIADSVILIAAGYAADTVYGPTLGWCAALLAMLTAYVRVLGASIGAGTYFIGPTAKQQRMAIMTVACAVAAVVEFWRDSGIVLSVALAVICVGCVPTTYRRLNRIVADLQRKAGGTS